MTTRSTFEPFAARFVCAYWETVKSGAFTMPPNEPVEETVDELLSDISVITRSARDPGNESDSFQLSMINESGDSWRFLFQPAFDGAWQLVGASTQSEGEKQAHDLLGPVYAEWFAPFLRHVTEMANLRHMT
ncbi:MAG: hypothetical protein ACYTEP_02310, partial [Planctomycetota bacterium]